MSVFPKLSAAVMVAVVTLSGCGANKTDDQKTEPRIAERVDPTTPEVTTVSSLREKLKLNEGEGQIAEELGKITQIDLSRTRVTDLTPLKGLPLKQLYLRQTRVSDLTPLENMPLEYLNLLETRVSDISAVKAMKLNTLWLNDTKVKDLSPLKEQSLVSLDITGTPVTDLSPISAMTSLERLNLERCAVTDLTPLKDLTLKRIVFQPSKITKGLDVIRKMDSLQHMHTQFQNTRDAWLTPSAFWAKHAAGTLPKSR